ncbi:5'/3'-nucleotidase SurE [Deinococcus fonticola]|uniref:5'/3'-nucleotidase SurE n=1 Tax=Deinococcus fonticola TaxID=2528713 RepID=UPI0010751894|nr:5'/3'-nucleotidase SurE [Deinococcus fonticola]
MKILVTNDDGIHSPGLWALARAAAAFGEVNVVAPSAEQSAMGHAISVYHPLRLKPFGFSPLPDIPAYTVTGTPADCSALGLYEFGADVVLSGVNLGSNIGHEIWHSGTVSAARQALLQGVPGIAFSTIASETADPDFELLAPWLSRCLDVLLLLLPQERLLFNVNLPPQPQGLRWAEQSTRHYFARRQAFTTPNGKVAYWFDVTPEVDPQEGSDRWAVEHGYVSITPLRMNLTAQRQLAGFREKVDFGE